MNSSIQELTQDQYESMSVQEKTGIFKFLFDSKLTSKSNGNVINIPQGSIISLKNGVIHRNNKPALYVFKNKKITTICYFKDGREHREDGPSSINFAKYEGSSKIFLFKFYWINGFFKEIGTPAQKEIQNKELQISNLRKNKSSLKNKLRAL